jgi:hypothetical protein
MQEQNQGSSAKKKKQYPEQQLRNYKEAIAEGHAIEIVED